MITEAEIAAAARAMCASKAWPAVFKSGSARVLAAAALEAAAAARRQAVPTGNLNKDPESWAKVVPDAFLTGSIVQARNVIEMAVQDIARLALRLRMTEMDLASAKWEVEHWHGKATDADATYAARDRHIKRS